MLRAPIVDLREWVGEQEAGRERVRMRRAIRNALAGLAVDAYAGDGGSGSVRVSADAVQKALLALGIQVSANDET